MIIILFFKVRVIPKYFGETKNFGNKKRMISIIVLIKYPIFMYDKLYPGALTKIPRQNL